MSRFIFPSYLALLFCLPLPFAGVIPWGWAFFAGLSCGLLLAQFFSNSQTSLRSSGISNSDFMGIPAYSYPVLLPLCFVAVFIGAQWNIGRIGAYVISLYSVKTTDIGIAIYPPGASLGFGYIRKVLENAACGKRNTIFHRQ